MNDKPDPEAILAALVAGLDGIRISSAPIAVDVRCANGDGKFGQCGAQIGTVISTQRGLAWVPAAEVPGASDLPESPGRTPMLLPVTDDPRHPCLWLSSTCTAGHLWWFHADDLIKRARSNPGKPYRMTRGTPPNREVGQTFRQRLLRHVEKRASDAERYAKWRARRPGPRH